MVANMLGGAGDPHGFLPFVPVPFVSMASSTTKHTLEPTASFETPN